MDILETYAVLTRVAQEDGVDLKTVIKQIDEAIAEAMANPDPAVRARWKCIPRKGEKPTAVEFVAYMRSIVHKD